MNKLINKMSLTSSKQYFKSGSPFILDLSWQTAPSRESTALKSY